MRRRPGGTSGLDALYSFCQPTTRAFGLGRGFFPQTALSFYAFTSSRNCTETMDLLSGLRKGDSSRGGRAEFRWDDVKEDKDRENYLGHSLMARMFLLLLHRPHLISQ